ncbi:monosaccharide ABC transporter membrane protein, CUT2 family [Streptomyces sp. 1222.5]|uniref:ABC transporter permease n=1 Tax=unclassified Streptomyces TaxID=2593676 RepID=UPI000896F611|nr:MULTISPECIES: ABC transporter permease [unclassified Streptomyces]PKW11548.1 monosaccharide ABC transporter membrane protein (CUT2 family) [Streptomyces sp. 5112.2]SEB76057.1 monosaccharide ABC transporter membrane protein, CUT2 family [Streptomyces sp. 1222.5]
MTVTTPNPTPVADAPRSSGTRLVDRVFRMRELAILVVFLVMIAATQAGNSQFLSEQGIKDLLLNATILVLVATGQSLVVITRNVDLSVGSTLGISAFAAGSYLQGGGNAVVAILLAVLLGIGFGLLNGLLVSLGQVPALVVTLGTLYIIRGIDSIWVGSRQITAADLPGGFVDLGSAGVSAVPWLAVIALAALVATAYFLKHYDSGREMYALGSNPEAARLAGIPVRKRLLAAYTFCGALAGLAGVLYLARFGNVDSGTGNGYELTVVSAVVVGGIAFTGGVGSVYGAALGALLLTSINSVLPALGVSSVWVLAINGVLLLLAIAVDRVVALRVAAALKKKSALRRTAMAKETSGA